MGVVDARVDHAYDDALGALRVRPCRLTDCAGYRAGTKQVLLQSAPLIREVWIIGGRAGIDTKSIKLMVGLRELHTCMITTMLGSTGLLTPPGLASLAPAQAARYLWMMVPLLQEAPLVVQDIQERPLWNLRQQGLWGCSPAF